MENVGLHLFTISSNVNKQLILSKQEVVHMSNSTKPFHIKKIALHSILPYITLLTFSSNLVNP